MSARKRNILVKHLFTLLMDLILPVAGYNSAAQTVSVRAALDSTLMVIGGQMNLMLQVNQPADLLVAFPHLTDTVTASVEIARTHQRDTIRLENNRLSITQMYTVTSFDSGLHYIPPIRFEYMEREMQSSALSNSLALMVVNPFVDVDPEKGFFDLKEPYNLPFIIRELWRFRYWLLFIILLAAAAYGGWYFWKNRKIPLKEIFFKEQPKEPAHVVALRELDRIKNDKIWQAGQIKQFYSQLTDTLRRYMEERYHFPAMEQTSHEILQILKKTDLPDRKLYEKVERVLNTADLAKFAKYEPLPDENDMSLITAYFFVNQTKEEEMLTPEEAAQKSVNNEKTESQTTEQLR